MILLGPLLLACHSPAPPPPPPPDIVLVVVDTLRADHMSLYGHERPTTPAADALGAESMVFERALAHAGWTLPSMASILTGRLPSEHQATRDAEDRRRFNRLDETLPTIATLLRERGYRTGAWVNNAYMAPEFGLNRGFDLYDYRGAGGTDDRSATDTVAAALSWFAESDQPAFAFLHFMEPHYPYLPPGHLRHRFTGPGTPPVDLLFFSPEEIAGEARRTKHFSPEQEDWIGRLYDEEVLAADEALGDLVAGLRTQGRWERAVLALTADHGEELWDHGAFEHGHTLYGELIRVPLLLRAPGLAPARERAQAQHTDLFQTLVALAGASPPLEARGVDLRALAAGPQDRPVLSEDCLYGPPRVALTQGGHRLIVNLQTHAAGVFQVDQYGQRDVPIREPAEAQRLSAPLMDAMQEARGDLEIRDLPDRTAPLTEENMEKLRALGYVE